MSSVTEFFTKYRMNEVIYTMLMVAINHNCVLKQENINKSVSEDHSRTSFPIQYLYYKHNIVLSNGYSGSKFNTLLFEIFAINIRYSTHNNNDGQEWGSVFTCKRPGIS